MAVVQSRLRARMAVCCELVLRQRFCRGSACGKVFLAYFQPVIDELISSPLSNSYVEYVRNKMKPFAGKKLTESMEKASSAC